MVSKNIDQKIKLAEQEGKDQCDPKDLCCLKQTFHFNVHVSLGVLVYETKLRRTAFLIVEE